MIFIAMLQNEGQALTNINALNRAIALPKIFLMPAHHLPGVC